MVKELDVDLPPFFCPVDPVVHPDTDLVERRSGEWASSVGLVCDDAELERWLSSTSADFYGGMVPHACTDGFQLAADWVYWGFYFDDAHCDEGSNATSPHRIVPVAARLLRMLDSGDERLCAGNRYLLGLCDLARRYQKLATPTQYDRWVTAQRRWLFGVVQQITRRSTGVSPRLDDYLVTRLHEAGGPPTQSMFEVANNAEVPGAEMDSPPVRAMTELFWMVASLDNDLVSRYREVLEQHDRYNAVDVLARERSLSEQDATVELIKLRDRMMVLLLRLRDELTPTASEPLRVYLTTLVHGIRSNVDWSLRTPRYAALRPSEEFPDGVRVRLRSTCTDTPTDMNPEPPPLPSIAWWWTQAS
jgi:hypothetical protein